MTSQRRSALLHGLKALGRPTIAAQFVAAFAALISVALLSRLLSKADYGTYASLVAVLAFTNAFLGTAIGTRALASATQSSGRVEVGSRLVFASASTIVVGVTPVALYLGRSPLIAGSACLCGAALVAADISQGVILGQARHRRYLAATSSRAVISVIGIPLVALVSEPRRAAAALGVLGLSAVVFAAFGIDGVKVARRPAPGAIAISSIGAANLALWVLATGDRVVLGIRAGTATVAAYAVAYGLIDRVVRVIVNGHVTEWMPEAFCVTGNLRVRSLSRLGAYSAVLVCATLSVGVGVRPVVAGLTGGRFVPGYGVGLMVALGLGFLGVAAPFYVVLVAAGRARWVAIAASSAAIVNLGGNWVLDGRWGAEAAAAMTATGYGAYAAICVVAYAVHIEIRQRAPHAAAGRASTA